MVGQTAVDDKAADTTDPHANSAGPAVPVGTMNKLSNGIDNGVKGGNGREVNEEGEWASGIDDLSSNDDSGDEDVRHAYVVPNSTQLVPYHAEPPPDDSRPPPSVSLEGEMSDQSTTTPLLQMPYDQGSNVEAESKGDDEWQSQKEEARDKASRDDKEGLETREVKGTLNKGKERMTVMNVNEDDALHDPGGETTTPDSKPPSVQLEGESGKRSSLHVEADEVETEDDHVEADPDDQNLPRNPVGTTDGDKHRPSEPTESPDKEEGERGQDGEGDVELRVEPVQLN
ncbi:hypothetical protein PAXINDRAFT_6883 [Paxillus involutus ATCC 200175]|nr:hypothetical protein PAXINDRAFT_6883 [Paxillus involutus ATCC 200175]